MKGRFVVYGLLGALIIGLWPTLKRSVPRLQIQLAGQLLVEEKPSGRKFVLSPDQTKRLATSIDFDGQRYLCGPDEHFWRITPAKSSGFVLTVGESCIGEFKGWITASGLSAGTDKVLLEFSALHKDK